MRNVLFRGKIRTGEWLYGYFYKNGIGLCKIATSNGVIEIVDPNSVGEYAGRTDRNGKMIFEGDIVRRYEDIFRIAFKDGAFWMRQKHSNEIILLADCNWFDLEVIGNVTDNKDLIIETKKKKGK